MPDPAACSTSRPNSATDSATDNSRYVQFIDADDWLAPEKLERQLAVLEGQPDVGLVYCDYYFAFESTGGLERVDSDELGSLESDPLDTFWIRWSFPPRRPRHWTGGCGPRTG